MKRPSLSQIVYTPAPNTGTIGSGQSANGRATPCDNSKIIESGNDIMKTPISGVLLLAGFMVVDDPLPYYRLGIEWLTVLVEDYLGYGPANLWPILGMASVFQIG